MDPLSTDSKYIIYVCKNNGLFINPIGFSRSWTLHQQTHYIHINIIYSYIIYTFN